MKFILGILILNFVISCKSSKDFQSKDEIIELGQSMHCGDKGGRFHITKITKDSTIRISGMRNKNIADTTINLTVRSEWEKLIKIINVDDFVKRKQGELGNLAADGCIKNFYIKTLDSTYAKAGLNFSGNAQNAESIDELIK